MRNSIRAHHNQIDLLCLHDEGSHAICDQDRSNPRPIEFPGCETSSLKKRTGFAGVDCDIFSLRSGRVKGSDCSSNAGGRQSSSIAMGDDARSSWNECASTFTQGIAELFVLLLDGRRFLPNCAAVNCGLTPS
jgi:hypothetical protein